MFKERTDFAYKEYRAGDCKASAKGIKTVSSIIETIFKILLKF